MRTSPETAAADIAAARSDGVTFEEMPQKRAAAQAQWHATYVLSCGHSANDGLREDERGHLGCALLTCEGKVVRR